MLTVWGLTISMLWIVFNAKFEDEITVRDIRVLYWESSFWF